MLTCKVGKASDQTAANTNPSSTSTTAANSTANPTNISSEISATKKKKRRVNDKDFKDDYKLCIKEALTKLIEKDSKVKNLDRRECCAVLCEFFDDFKRDVASLKVSNVREMLQNALDKANKFLLLLPFI